MTLKCKKEVQNKFVPQKHKISMGAVRYSILFKATKPVTSTILKHLKHYNRERAAESVILTTVE